MDTGMTQIVTLEGKCIDAALQGALKAQSMGTWPSPWHTFRRRLRSLAGVNRVEEAGLFLGV